MAISEIHSTDPKMAYVLKPNRSLSGTQVCVAFVVIAAALLLVTVYFIIQGAWLVLPFAGLELLILGIAVLVQYRWSGQLQLIEIDEKRVTASSNAPGAERISFPRAWLKVRLVSGQSDWHPRRLVLGSHGRYIEVGAFLLESEREDLASRIRASL